MLRLLLTVCAVFATQGLEAKDFYCSDHPVAPNSLHADFREETALYAQSPRRHASMETEVVKALAGRGILASTPLTTLPPSGLLVLDRRRLEAIQTPIAPPYATDALESTPQSENVEVLRKAFAASQCSADDVHQWNTIQETLQNLVAGKSAEVLVRDFLKDPQTVDSEARARIALYVAHAKTMLNTCFSPAEASTFVVKHKLLNRIARLQFNEDTHCTATQTNDPRYFLTARHCFGTHEARVEKSAWIAPHGSADRFEVCAVAEKDAFSKLKNSILSDQVIVRVAKGAAKQPILYASAPKSINTMAEADASRGPTLLTLVSYFPNSQELAPAFKTGFVVPNPSVCAATQRSSSCFLHLCGVIGGGSGAPLFRNVSDKLEIAGTHVGSFDHSIPSCDQGHKNQALTLDVSGAEKLLSSSNN